MDELKPIRSRFPRLSKEERKFYETVLLEEMDNQQWFFIVIGGGLSEKDLVISKQ